MKSKPSNVASEREVTPEAPLRPEMGELPEHCPNVNGRFYFVAARRSRRVDQGQAKQVVFGSLDQGRGLPLKFIEGHDTFEDDDGEGVCGTDSETDRHGTPREWPDTRLEE
jgi:hypothetical protein